MSEHSPKEAAAPIRRRDILTGAIAAALLTPNAAHARSLDTDTTRAPASQKGGTVTRGAGAWVYANRYASAAAIAALAAPSYIGWISGYTRLEVLAPDRRGRYDWSALDAVQEAAHRVEKPWKDMTIHGSLEVGRPRWHRDHIPDRDWITVTKRGDSTFPVPWSAAARALRVEFEEACADRYGSDPLHAQHRVVADWPLAEPWFGGSDPHLWLPAWRGHAGAHATWRDLQLDYQKRELDAIVTSARLWPQQCTISMATGYGFRDVTTTKPATWSRPEAHPDRYTTWSSARDRLGDRFQPRQNGAGSPHDDGNYDGAQGFGAWLGRCFGPGGIHPGPIGCQMVKNIGADDRMDLARFEKTIAVESGRCRDAEIYSDDLAKPHSRVGAAVADVLARYADRWQ